MSPAKLRRLEQLRNVANKAENAYLAYKKKLAKDCDHPQEHRSEWTHSSSNGYGSWRTELMPFCEICRKVQYNSAYNYRWGEIPHREYDD